MADCLLDLVLRPGETDLPVVRAELTVVAAVPTMLGGDQPGEVHGHPVPAEMVRVLARGLGLLPEPTDPDHATADPEAAADATAYPDDLGRAAPDAAPAAAEERWWAQVEARALRGDWGGEDDPPAEELQRYWTEQAAWLAGVTPDETAGSTTGGRRVGRAPPLRLAPPPRRAPPRSPPPARARARAAGPRR